MKEFVHLHNHSDYSLLRATSTIDGLINTAVEFNMPGLALTDDGNLFAAYKFYEKSRAMGINPIIGCDFFLAPHDRHQKGGTQYAKNYHRLVLLAENTEGYHNLKLLSSLGYTEGFYYRPRIDNKLLQQYHGGLIALSGGFGGEISKLISRNNLEQAWRTADYYAQLFGKDNFFFELTDQDIPEQRQINRELVSMSQSMGIGMVATNDTYYLKKDDAPAHDVLLCIGTKRTRNDSGRFKFSSEEFYLKSPEEMWQIFADNPQALTNSMAIHERCNLEMPRPGSQLPDYDIPPEFENTDDYLRHISQEGLCERYGMPSEELQQRLNHELNTIITKNFTMYFLIVWDFIRHARETGIPVGPGRGSGAGSIVAYSLRITDIDPIRYGLIFERFLNPARDNMPDLDIDFCFERRQEVIDYVIEKYGSDRVGQIITFGTLKPRAVIRDVARVLDIPVDDADRIAKLVPDDPKITIERALEDEPKFKALINSNKLYQEIISISRKLENLHRHASTHAAGIVIGREALLNYVPLFRDPKTGSISTQFTMEQLEDNGLIKMDILGLKTLTIIQATVNLIARQGIQLDINSIPYDDVKTFESLGEGKSQAVFQFESEGMQKILMKAKPNCIEDLIALNSLYRPGPLENINNFLSAKNGHTPITYPHPKLESVLKETYGVIIYQEQVLETVRIVAGFSLGKADLLRQAMGKKKEEVIVDMRAEFMEGSAKNGMDKKTAASIFELLKAFAGYGFNKSHSTAYSVLAYKTAYLKSHYPVQFMAANLSNEVAKRTQFLNYINETRGMGIDILSPDINQSEKNFSVLSDSPAYQNKGIDTGDREIPKIIFGFVGIKGVGHPIADEILRKRNVPFKSIEDFLERINIGIINRRSLEILIHSGVFDSLFSSRKAIMDQIDRLINYARSRKHDRDIGQNGLFDEFLGEEYIGIKLDPDNVYPPLERLEIERNLLGACFSGHPLDSYRDQWFSVTTLDLGNIPVMESSSPYQILGQVSECREIMTQKKTQMATGVIEDFKGKIRFVIFPHAFKKYGSLIRTGVIVKLQAALDFRNNIPQLIVEEAQKVDEVVHQDNGSIHIRLRAPQIGHTDNCAGDREELLRILRFTNSNPGRCSMFIHLNEGGIDQVIRCAPHFQISPSIIDELGNYNIVDETWQEHMGIRM